VATAEEAIWEGAMRLARAMVKGWEELPEKYRCCEWQRWQVEKVSASGEFKVDLDSLWLNGPVACRSCQRRVPATPVVSIAAGLLFERNWECLPVDSIHIDEGPVEGV
jgi:hypothetical protein